MGRETELEFSTILDVTDKQPLNLPYNHPYWSLLLANLKISPQLCKGHLCVVTF